MGLVTAFLGYRVLVTTNPEWPLRPGEMNRVDRIRRLRHAGVEPYPVGGQTPATAR